MKTFKRATASAIILAVLLSLCTLFPLAAIAYEDPGIEATSVVLADSKTGLTLYAKNENEKMNPASITKIMTLLLASEACSNGNTALTDSVTVSENIYYDIDEEESYDEDGIQVGETLSFESLLYLAALESSNEACNAIAEHVSGNIESFISLMNTRAEELGCTDTHFSNTHGLSADNHYSTAHDIALILQAGLNDALFTEVLGTASYIIPATDMHEARDLFNTNDLIQGSSQYYYDAASLGKTGYTDESGYCLASAANNDELSLVAVVMGALNETDEDGITDAKSFSETIRLFDWGFSSFSYQTILSPSDLIADVPVKMGDGADSVVLCPSGSIRALVDSDSDLSEFHREVRIFSEETGEELVAPIKEGDVLGSITVTRDGESYGTMDLVANTSISLQRVEYMKLSVKETLNTPIVKIGILLVILLVVLYVIYVILYNRKRARQKREARNAARARAAAANKRHTSSIGKSFEDIEVMHRDDQNAFRK